MLLPRLRLVPARSDLPEEMDQPGCDPAEVADAHRVLRRVNRQFFGAGWVLRRELGDWLASQGQRPARVRLLDVGAGSGDLAHEAGLFLEALGIATDLVALDRDPVPLGAARDLGVPAVRGDALRLPFPDVAFDLVLAVKFAHHFSGPHLDRLMTEISRVSHSRMIVLEIRRSWLAWVGFVAWSRVFTRNHLVRRDGPLSVLRGFTAEELRRIGPTGFRWVVRRYAGFQLALVGDREGVP